MTIAFLYWLLMILWLIFGFVWTGPETSPVYRRYGGHVLLWILLFLVGWKVFGFPLKD